MFKLKKKRRFSHPKHFHYIKILFNSNERYFNWQKVYILRVQYYFQLHVASTNHTCIYNFYNIDKFAHFTRRLQDKPIWHLVWKYQFLFLIVWLSILYSFIYIVNVKRKHILFQNTLTYRRSFPQKLQLFIQKHQLSQ